MKNSLQYLVLSIIVLVIGAVAEELLPKFLGVGFPILLSSVYFVSMRRSPLAATLFSAAAGGLSDALSSLPPMTSTGFFLLVVLMSRAVPLPILVMFAVYPLYQIWLALWASGIGGEVYVRILMSIPIGGLTALSVRLVLLWCEKRAAIDDVE